MVDFIIISGYYMWHAEFPYENGGTVIRGESALAVGIIPLTEPVS